MILQKINKQSCKPNALKPKNKGSYSFSLNSVSPHRTNFIFKKIKQPEEIQVNCIPSYNSVNDVNANTSTKNNNDKKKDSLIIQQSTELSCTNFMKHYIDKLKKQRKRHNKILKNKINAQKQEQQLRSNSANKIYLGKQHAYMTKQLNNIFVLERLSQTNRKIHTSNFMNTISMAAEQLNNLDGKFSRRYFPIKQKQSKSERKNQSLNEPKWANKDRIDKLIRQIRQSRQKMVNETELCQISQISKQLQKKINQHQNINPSLMSVQLKSLESTTRFRSYSYNNYNKRNSRAENSGFKTLQPWKQQVQIQKAQFGGIQQYNKNFLQQF